MKADCTDPATVEEVEAEVRRLINLYGAEPVRIASRRLTLRKRGNQRLPDWEGLHDFLTPDVAQWLFNGTLRFRRSAHSIAVDFAKANPGHNAQSTVERVARKLRRKQSREMHVLTRALFIGFEALPYRDYIRTLVKLREIHPPGPWDILLSNAQERLRLYSESFGDPDSTSSMLSLESRLNPEMPIRSGLLALASLSRRERTT